MGLPPTHREKGAGEWLGRRNEGPEGMAFGPGRDLEQCTVGPVVEPSSRSRKRPVYTGVPGGLPLAPNQGRPGRSAEDWTSAMLKPVSRWYGMVSHSIPGGQVLGQPSRSRGNNRGPG